MMKKLLFFLLLLPAAVVAQPGDDVRMQYVVTQGNAKPLDFLVRVVPGSANRICTADSVWQMQVFMRYEAGGGMRNAIREFSSNAGDPKNKLRVMGTGEVRIEIDSAQTRMTLVLRSIDLNGSPFCFEAIPFLPGDFEIDMRTLYPPAPKKGRNKMIQLKISNWQSYRVKR